MRETFDRLIGPVVVVHRPPSRSLAALGSVAGAALMPVELSRWKVLTGRRPARALFDAIAECAVPDDIGIVRAAARHGLRVSPAVVDEERAANLLAMVREKRAGGGNAPLRDPLIVYPDGEDPRPMWKTHVSPDFFERDTNDDLADAIAWCFRAIGSRPELAEWDNRSEAVARAWQSEDGAVSLYRLAIAEIRRAPRLDRAGWPPVFGLALLRASRKVKDHRSLWQTLVVASPLLLATAEAAPAMSSHDVHTELLIDTVSDWRRFAREMAAWLRVVDELAVLDEEIKRGRRSPHVGPPSTVEIRSAVDGLRIAFPSRGNDLRHHFHDLAATDTDGIRAVLETLLAARLAAVGLEADAAGGTLVSLDAASLLSLRTALAPLTCGVCGKRVARGPRCTLHQRKFERDRKRLR